MIISVSMSPSVDKIIHLLELKPGQLNRVDSVVTSAGGKGINVANVLSSFTKDVVLTGFVGEQNNAIIDFTIDKLQEQGITVDFVKIPGSNRTNLKLIENGGRLTEINESGFSVSKEDLNQLNTKLLSYAKEGNIFILTGSTPKGVSSKYYAELTTLLKEQGASVFVDTGGDLLKNAVESLPKMIKPNQEELLELFNQKSVSEKLLIGMAKELCNKGIETVVVSRGSLGSLFVTNDSVYRCEAMTLDVRSAVGAGDAITAVFAYAYSNNISLEDTIKLCVAAASHTVTLDSSFLTDKEKVLELVDKVVINKLE